MLKMQTFKIRVRVVPTILAQRLLGAKVRTESRTIYGYTLKDAKRRFGIQ